MSLIRSHLPGGKSSPIELPPGLKESSQLTGPAQLQMNNPEITVH
jgi:hypothetical protein